VVHLGKGTSVVTRFHVRHSTLYQYESSMNSTQMIAHLVPRATPQQQVVESTFVTSPIAEHRRTHLDVFGNLVTYFAIDTPHDQLEVIAESTVDVADPATPVDDISLVDALTALASWDDSAGELIDWCRLDSPVVGVTDELRDYAAPSFPTDGGVVAGLTNLSARIFSQFEFDPHATDVSTPLDEVMRLRRGVCQDFAHLAVGCLRSVGLPARYVSGYLETTAPPGLPKLVGADASHAWCAVFVPGFGWLDADPTNHAVPPDRHVTIAWARDYSDIPPLRGVTFGPPSAQTLSVAVDVTRLTP
jgi:transglutaminase-like putative cysteine protease